MVAVRFLGGGLLLWPFARRRRPVPGEVRAALLCAVALLAGYVLLNLGLQRTTSTAAAFITYLLVILVPVLDALIHRHPPAAPVAAGVVLAAAGLLLLAGGGGAGRGIGLGLGELFALGCAFAFSVHILLLGRFAPGLDVLRFTALQLLLVGAGGLLPALATGELLRLHGGEWPATGYLAIAGLGGLVLQITGQQVVGPTRTSLLLMLEPVLAAVGGYVIGERLHATNLLGALLILGGVLLGELATLDRSVKQAG